MDEFWNAISSHPCVVVDIYKTDCEPCQRFLKIFDRVSSLLMEAGAKLVKINIADAPELKSIFELDAVPTFLYFVDGQEKARHFGIKPTLEMVKLIQGL